MQYINKILRVCRRHQTRQQLRYLTNASIKDIGKSPNQIDKELNKNNVSSIVHQFLNKLYLLSVRRG